MGQVCVVPSCTDPRFWEERGGGGGVLAQRDEESIIDFGSRASAVQGGGGGCLRPPVVVRMSNKDSQPLPRSQPSLARCGGCRWPQYPLITPKPTHHTDLGSWPRPCNITWDNYTENHCLIMFMWCCLAPSPNAH